MIIIRRAELAEISVLLEIERSAVEAFRSTKHAYVADEAVKAEDLLPLVAAQSVWVAEINAVPVGFVAVERLEMELHVHELAVHLDHQRKGIGRGLMNAGIEAGRAAGYSAATLTTFRNIAWNAPFYQRLGFAIIEAPPLHLSAILLSEAERGLTDRCAMRLKLCQGA